MDINFKINIDDIKAQYSTGERDLLTAGRLTAFWSASLPDGRKVWDIYVRDAKGRRPKRVRTCFSDDLPEVFFPDASEDFEMNRVLFKIRWL